MLHQFLTIGIPMKPENKGIIRTQSCVDKNHHSYPFLMLFVDVLKNETKLEHV